MTRRCFHRLTTTFIVVLSLLFSQLALAQYVCPQQSTMTSMAAMMASGQSCDGMDQRQPTLCHQHAADQGKTVEKVKLPVASLPAIVQVLELPLLPEPAGAIAIPAVGSSKAHPPSDPLYLATLRLRV
jgi:hypothetical protein